MGSWWLSRQLQVSLLAPEASEGDLVGRGGGI